MKGIYMAVLLSSALMSGCGDSPAEQQGSQTPAVSSEPVPAAASQATTEKDDGPVLAGREAGAAFSDYMSQLNAALLSHSAMQQLQIAKVKQAYEFHDLEKYTAAAEELKESTMKAHERMLTIQPTANLSDEDLTHFEAAGEAVDQLMAVRVDLAVDVAAEAHTGMNMLDGQEMAQLIRDTKKANSNLQAVAKKAYAHFGYKPKEIDWVSFTIKGRVPNKS